METHSFIKSYLKCCIWNCLKQVGLARVIVLKIIIWTTNNPGVETL